MRRQLVFALTALCVTTSAMAIDRPVSEAERVEIVRLMQRYFDATRDGNTHALAEVVPTDREFTQIFPPGTEPLVERHRRAVSDALTELHTRFAAGTFVGIDGFETGSNITIERCSTFASIHSECVLGPVIEWTANGQHQRMRVGRLVRVGGHWKVFAPRL
jgi:hypothetical protein